VGLVYGRLDADGEMSLIPARDVRDPLLQYKVGFNDAKYDSQWIGGILTNRDTEFGERTTTLGKEYLDFKLSVLFADEHLVTNKLDVTEVGYSNTKVEAEDYELSFRLNEACDVLEGVTIWASINKYEETKEDHFPAALDATADGGVQEMDDAEGRGRDKNDSWMFMTGLSLRF